ncbi:MAG: FIST C-terminal domain-containing protein [Micavibrio aeruginosavorus]|nr:FIST C-terminal domain-containing protein [Micavibrio aeruginosavorus]
MKSVAIQSNPENFQTVIQRLSAIRSQLVLVFSSKEILEKGEVISSIRKAIPGVNVMGCSTSGEIGETVEDNSLSVLGLRLENSSFKLASVPLGHENDSRSAGEAVTKALSGKNLKAMIVFAPGLVVNGSEFVQGLKKGLPEDVCVSGGLAGVGMDLGRPCVALNGDISGDEVIALGLYGEHIHAHGGSMAGWKPFGPRRRVTKARKNILYELDEKPALALYREYLGDRAVEPNFHRLLYPLAIMDESGEMKHDLIRSPIGADEETSSIILAGNLKTGDIVSLMYAGTDELVEGARSAAMKALHDRLPVDESAAICISCYGRRMMMGEDTEEEVYAVRDIFQGVPIAGFYSYGEIGIHDDTRNPEIYNQTMTVIYITEHVC